MQDSTPQEIPKDSQEFQISSQFEWIPGLDCRLRLFSHNLQSDIHGKTVLLFVHGYKGYAQWGCWGRMFDALAQSGIPGFRLDFAMNGTTAECPASIVDLEAWSRNTYSREVQETIAALRHLRSRGADVVLMGHSRGGGIAICATAATAQTHFAPKALVLLASVADFQRRFPRGQAFKKWEQSDCLPVINGRTGETYCHRFGFYLDFAQHPHLLNIREQAARIQVPVWAIHAEDDEAVKLAEFRELQAFLAHNPRFDSSVLASGGHTFGAREPWPANQPLPKETAEIVKDLGRFIAQL